MGKFNNGMTYKGVTQRCLIVVQMPSTKEIKNHTSKIIYPSNLSHFYLP